MIKKRITALLTAMLFSVSMFSLPAFAAEHAQIHYSDIEYEHIELTEFYSLTDSITELTTDVDNYDSVVSLARELVAFYYHLDTEAGLARLLNCQDVTNLIYQDEFQYCQTILAEAENSLGNTMKIVLESPCANAVYEVADEKMMSAISQSVYNGADMSVLSPLISEETQLDSQYKIAAGAEYRANINGEEMTLEEIKNANLSNEAYINAIREINKNKNAALGEIYLQLVRVRRDLAEACGSDNYAEFCYENSFYRDYSPEDSKMLSALVKEYIVPACKNFSLKTTDIDFSKLNNLDYSSETLLSEVKMIITNEFPELLESYDYMCDYGFYDIDEDENKSREGFVTYLTEYNAPFMFIHPYGNYDDIGSLVHETGHYNRDYIIGGGSFKMDLNEIDSQGLELLFYDFYDEMLGDSECADLLKIKLINSWMRVIIDGCMYDEFQQVVYDNPDMTLSEINQAYYKLLSDYGLKSSSSSCDLELEEAYGWMNIKHNFTEPFYYISYAASMIPAWELWMQAQTDFDGAKEKYLQLVSRENSSTYLQELSDLDFPSTIDESTIRDLSQALDALTDNALEELENDRHPRRHKSRHHSDEQDEDIEESLVIETEETQETQHKPDAGQIIKIFSTIWEKMEQVEDASLRFKQLMNNFLNDYGL